MAENNTPQSQASSADFVLREILTGIAESLDETQIILRDREPYDAFGRPNTIYQVPYLDFNLRVISQFQTVITEDSTEYNLLKFRPATSTTVQEAKTEIFSSIKGQFVASIPNEGLPQTVLQIKAESLEGGLPGQFTITVVVQNTAGELLTNSKVEFNYNAAASEALSEIDPLSTPVFNQAEVFTDGSGVASIIVSLPEAEFVEGNFFVVQVNVGTVVKTISLGKI